MRAPIYRNIESKNTLLGLAFPTEVVVVVSIGWLSMLALAPALAAIAVCACYAGIRLASRARAPLFFQHFLLFQVRQWLFGGLLSAAARSQPRQFPHCPYKLLPRAGGAP